MRAALRHLCQHGAEALKPQKAWSKHIQAPNGFVAKPSREIWRRPRISKRVANDLRKAAIRQGTYGSFHATTGEGWDPTWDLVLKSNRHYSERPVRQPSKKTAKQRTRQDRAAKLQQNLQTQQHAQIIQSYYQEKEEARVQDKSFEARYKRMMRGSGGASGGGPSR